MKIRVFIGMGFLLSPGLLHAQDAQDSAGTAPSDIASTEMASGSGALPAPDPVQGIAPPTTPDEADSLDQNLYGEDQALADDQPEPVAQGRPWNVDVHASTEVRHDNNLFISATDKRSDFITLLTAGLAVTLGDYTVRQNNYLVADYTGIGEVFARYTAQDAYEQLASLETQILLARLTLLGSFAFQDLADEDIDIGTRARRQIYTANGSARYDISDKTYIKATAQVTIAHYDLYLGSNDERGGLSINYLPNPSVTVGIGILGGILNVADASSQTYEQILSSLRIEATGKFTLTASAGVEDRQLPDHDSLISPVFQLTGDYKPAEGIDINLTAYRQVENSAYYAGSDYTTAGLSAGIQYELSSRFTCLLSGGYENSDYRNVAAGGGVSRNDNYFFVRPALQYTASRYCTVELYYSYCNNQSSLSTSTFNDTQAGVIVKFTF